MGAMKLALSALLLAAAAAPLHAAAPDFYGSWLITEAHRAPWAKPSEDTFDTAEQHRLIGSKVVYRKMRIDGPRPLACDKTRYRQYEAAPDLLFQGGLTDPVPQARALGFHLRTIPTLETGCEGDIDFHFVDPTTALFGLNNMIYTLRKQPEKP
jgi:hypothetical protein